MSKLRPFLLRHQARLDQVVEIVYREIVRICLISLYDEAIDHSIALTLLNMPFLIKILNIRSKGTKFFWKF